ncbi:MAG: MFS transporter [Trueperaceae bacterium]|nr:MFS transporter [Trueperaceae bacterium]
MSPKLTTTFSYYLLFIVLGILLPSLGPLLPSLAEQTGSTIAQISSLFAAASLGRMTGALLAGRLLDRMPGHPVIATTLIFIAAIALLMPGAKLLWLLTGLYFAFGLTQAIIDVGANTLIIWIHRDKVAPFMNALHLSFGIGAFLSPLIIARTLGLADGTQWAYWAMAVITLPSMFWLFRLQSPGSPERDAEPDQRPAPPLLLGLLILFFGAYVSAEAGFGGWIYSYALESGMANAQTAAYLTSAFYAAYTLGRILAIPIASRVAPKLILVVDFIISIIGLGIILLFRDSSTFVWIGTLLAGLGMASVFPTALAFAERRMTVTGKITSFFFVGGSLGGIITPWLIGQLFESIGPIMVIVVIFAIAILGFILLILLILNSPSNVENPKPIISH